MSWGAVGGGVGQGMSWGGGGGRPTYEQGGGRAGQGMSWVGGLRGVACKDPFVLLWQNSKIVVHRMFAGCMLTGSASCGARMPGPQNMNLAEVGTHVSQLLQVVMA